MPMWNVAHTSSPIVMPCSLRHHGVLEACALELSGGPEHLGPYEAGDVVDDHPRARLTRMCLATPYARASSVTMSTPSAHRW